MVKLDFSTSMKAFSKTGYQAPGIAQYVHRQFIRLWEDSVKAFINAAYSVLSQHVDTGMSIASLEPLAISVRLKTLITTALKGGYSGSKYYDFSGPTDRAKSPQYGRELGQSAYVLSFGTPELPQLDFVFKIVVFQYYLHEFGYAIPSTGIWNTLGKGKTAFLEFFTTNLHSYVHPKQIVKVLLHGR